MKKIKYLTTHLNINGLQTHTYTHTHLPQIPLYRDIHSQQHNISSANDAFSEPIPTIDALYSPKFALEEVRDFVMEALHEAVEVNQVANRDPIGWSNENLFL